MPIIRRLNLEPEHWMFSCPFPERASRLKKSTRRSINTGSLAMRSAIGSKSPVNEGKPASKANYRPASR